MSGCRDRLNLRLRSRSFVTLRPSLAHWHIVFQFLPRSSCERFYKFRPGDFRYGKGKRTKGEPPFMKREKEEMGALPDELCGL
jgi:hypothetical protein